MDTSHSPNYLLPVDTDGDGTVDLTVEPSYMSLNGAIFPKINAGSDITLECEGDGTVVELPAPIIEHFGDQAPTIINDAPAEFPLGCTTVTFTVVDSFGHAASDSIEVCVVDTTAPDLTAPVDVTVECTGPDVQSVPLGDAVASDICCNDSVTITNDAPPLFQLGDAVVTWTATDCNGNSMTTTQTVHVVDTTDPSIALSMAPSMLWPPNHKMVEVTPTIATDDVCCDSDIEITLISVTMDEGDSTDTFDPNYDPDPDTGYLGSDIQIVDGRIYLRAERSGKSDGRVYTITYRATDCAGNTSTASATVTVPHDMGE